jgi:hypothetical protein
MKLQIDVSHTRSDTKLTPTCLNKSALNIEISSMLLTVIAEKGLCFALPFRSLGTSNP